MDPNHTGPATPLTPVGESERIDSLDVLRGLALLGIFVMNIPSFALSSYAFFKPPLQGGFEGADYWSWLLGHLFFDQKMMSIFSMLFGAGIVLFSSRIEQKRGRSAGVHYRRMGWLLVIGMLHAYLIWFGDILVSYALVGMVVFLFRRLPPVMLVVLAAILLPIAPILAVAQQLGFEYVRSAGESGDAGFADMWSQMQVSFYPTETELEAERQTVMSGFFGRAAGSAENVFFMQTYVLLTWAMWRVSAMMLLGMALFKWGVFSAQRSFRFYSILTGTGLLVGMPLILLGVSGMHASDFDPLKYFGVNGAFNAFGSVGIALAWVGLIMIVCKAAIAPPVRNGLAAVGRMAFTNYLMQSLIGATLFYGWGFGLFGQLSRSELLLVVVAVWAFQIAFSLVWLKRFRFGPMEWLWRSLTYWRIEPIARSPRISPEDGTDR